MKQHTSNFKDELINHGKQQEVQITFNNTTLTGENINSVTPNYKGGLIKSVMKGLDIDSNVEIPAGTEINFKYGLLIGSNYEYLDFGNYIVYSVEKQKDVDSYKIIAYDKMLLAMKEYEHVEVQYPCSVLTYLDALCQQIGLSLGTSTFPNYLQNMEREYFMRYNEESQEWESLGYTYRDVLDDIAEVTGSTLYVKTVGDAEILYVGQPTETSEVIDENYFKDYDVNIGEKYGPINSVVLSRLGVDNIYSRDEQSIAQNGLYEIKITDNQIMNDNNRDRFLPGIYDALHGMEFYLNDLESIGIVYLDLLDRYTIQIGEELYSCVMLGDEIEITQGLEEHIYTDEPESSETDYSKADKTDRRINETSLIVDKQNQQITAAVANSTEALSQVTSLDVRVGTLESEIKTIADLTVTASGYGTVQFDEDDVVTNLSEPAFIKVYPVTYDIELLRPNAYLTPNTWYKHISINGTTTTQTITPIAPRSRKLKFTNMDTDEVFYFELPADLYYLSDSVYDTFIYDYQNDQCYIERKVNAVWNNGVLEKSALTSSVIETYTMPHDTVLTEGYYKVELLSYQTAYISITLLAKNIYTDQFALKAEMNSAITQTAEQIQTSVSETYATKNELNTQASRITQNSTSITAEVTNRQNADNAINASLQLKLDKDDNDQVVSMLNASADVISLTGNRINITSDKFRLLDTGEISVVDGSFKVITNSGTKLMDFSRSGLRYHNINGQEIGGLVSTWQTTEDAGDLFYTLYKGNAIHISKTSNDGTYFNDFMVFSDLNSEPFIRNTASGTLFPHNSGGGIVIRNGLAKTWNLSATTAEIEIRDSSDILIAKLSVKDGLITGYTVIS